MCLQHSSYPTFSLFTFACLLLQPFAYNPIHLHQIHDGPTCGGGGWGDTFMCNKPRIEFNNCPTRCDLFSLLYFCRQLYIFRALTPIIRSSYNCNHSFCYWLTGSTTIRSRCWVGTQQRQRMVLDPVNRYQKLWLQLYELLMVGVNTLNM